MSPCPVPVGDAWLSLVLGKRRARNMNPTDRGWDFPTSHGTCTRAVIPERPASGSSISSHAACVVFSLTGLAAVATPRGGTPDNLGPWWGWRLGQFTCLLALLFIH